jgi:hypothetical protein
MSNKLLHRPTRSLNTTDSNRRYYWKCVNIMQDWFQVTYHSEACGRTGTPCSLWSQLDFLLSYFWYFVKLKLVSAAVLFTLWPLIGSHLNMLCNNLCILLTARNGTTVYICNIETSVTWPQQFTSQVPRHKDGWEGDTKKKLNWCKCNFFRHFVINICSIPLTLYSQFQCNIEQLINFCSCGLWINLSLTGHQVVLKHVDNYSIYLFMYLFIFLFNNVSTSEQITQKLMLSLMYLLTFSSITMTAEWYITHATWKWPLLTT